MWIEPAALKPSPSIMLYGFHIRRLIREVPATVEQTFHQTLRFAIGKTNGCLHSTHIFLFNRVSFEFRYSLYRMMFYVQKYSFYCFLTYKTILNFELPCIGQNYYGAFTIKHTVTSSDLHQWYHVTRCQMTFRTRPQLRRCCQLYFYGYK